MKNPELNAWCDYPHSDVPNSATGPLSGLSLAVKDIYEVAGYRNGWGQPTRLVEAEVSTRTQPVVQQMLDAGIEFQGMSQCEELCYSLIGINAHYGSPHNSAAPDRVTGGSSSGSASLIAAGVVDIATASDTGGSVRAPASFCGLVGLRTTHGRLSLDRTMPLAPSFDCFGWFAKDIQTYEKVGHVILGDDSHHTKLSRLIVAPQLEELLSGDEERSVFLRGSAPIFAQFDSIKSITDMPFSISDASRSFSICQAHDAWQALGDWITTRKPDLGSGIKERFEYGASISEADFTNANEHRGKVTAALEAMLESDGVLLLPTVPSCAPLKTEGQANLQAFRQKMLNLLCLSGLSGFPQITLPLESVHGAPFGISLLGPKGSDQALIQLAKQIMTK